MSSEPFVAKYQNTAPYEAVQEAVQARIPSHWPQGWQIEEANKLAEPLMKGLDAALQRLQERPMQGTSAEDGQFVRDITDIAAAGELRGFPLVEEDFPAERAWNNFTFRRQALLGIYACNPELAIEIARRRVVGLHGSVSGTLLSVLNHGLRPLAQLREKNALVMAGERGSHVGEGVRSAVSFMQLHETASRQVGNYLDLHKGQLTDERLLQDIAALAAHIRKESDQSREDGWDYSWRDVDLATLQEKMKLREYLLTPPATDKEALDKELIRLNFPVVYLIDDSEIQAKPEKDIAGFREINDRVILVSSSVRTEFAVKNGVTSKAVQAVLVPRAQTETVRELTIQAGIDTFVAPLEDVRCLGLQ